MKIPFYKYHGTGNDFIIIDQRSRQYLGANDQSIIEKMCNRRFGIGADGLMLIQEKEGVDFEMIYFNADGRTSSMCGNGGRCIVSLAERLGVFAQSCRFLAIDGIHLASIDDQGVVSLKMNNVKDIDQESSSYILDTGSPHYVKFVDSVEGLDMIQEGHAIRYNERFSDQGINVNLASYHDGILSVRTYERGVEAETFSCGTGVVASAISHSLVSGMNSGEVSINTLGGRLSVAFERTGSEFNNIWLNGPAKLVFEGTYEVESKLYA